MKHNMPILAYSILSLCLSITITITVVLLLLLPESIKLSHEAVESHNDKTVDFLDNLKK